MRRAKTYICRTYRLTTSRSKRKGLDKALFQIEQALKRVKSGEQSSEDHTVIANLHHLLSDRRGQSVTPSNASIKGRQQSSVDINEMSSDEDDEDTENTPDSHPYITQHREGSLTVDDAENPLQLLARASKLQLSPTPGGTGSSPGQMSRSGRRKQHLDQDDGDSEIQSFFTGFRVSLDVGDDIDPIQMGLVTENEAHDLFD